MDVVGHHMRNNVGKMHNDMGAIFTTNVSKEIIVTTVKGSTNSTGDNRLQMGQSSFASEIKLERAISSS